MESGAVLQESIWIGCVGCSVQTKHRSASVWQMPLVLLQGSGLFCLGSDLCLFLGLWDWAGVWKDNAED